MQAPYSPNLLSHSNDLINGKETFNNKKELSTKRNIDGGTYIITYSS